MKKIIFLIFVSLIFYTMVIAETQKELFDKGVLLFKQGQHQQAIDTFSKLIEIAPGNADAYKNRGVSYMKQEKFDLAIEDFEKAKELFPELKGLYSNLGVAWYYKKEYEKAIENYEIEIEMAPENHVAYFNRALCLAELDRNKEALEDLSKTLGLKPDFYWAICYKADLLTLEGEDIRAIEAYEEAIKQDPDNSYATDKLAQLRQKIDKKGEPVLSKKQPENTKEPNNSYALQAGAFLNQANANKMNAKLIKSGFDSKVLILKDSRDRTWYLVRSGNYMNKNKAQKASVSLKDKLGINPIIRPTGTW
ncbi:MAG: hypothetical protein DRH93_20120 [Deltaproteobacteria bacterium]|nr:MAG: hypothetical protein DRH93_20120 [Deltaproteobacteria bacterium]